MKLISIGSDNEFFLHDGEGIVAASNATNHSKESAYEMNGYRVHYDNALLEYSIPVCKTRQEFITAIKVGYLMALNHVEDFSPIIKSYHEFDMSVLASDPTCMVFGCNPDYNAWMEGWNESPSSHDNVRCAGGHVHLGVETEDKNSIVRMLDLVLGIPSLLLDPDNRIRQKRYGCLGSYRAKEYGLEYRVLSNFWVASDDLVGWVYDQCSLAVENVDDFGELISFFDKPLDELTQEDIESYVNYFNLTVPSYRRVV